MASLKSKLSAAMLALIDAGATASVMMAQFQDEKEGQSLTAYQDAGGILTVCGGVTIVDGKRVTRGMRLIAEQCKRIDVAEQKKALDWVDSNVKVTLNEPQKVGIASFCPWNIGPAKCFTSTFYKKMNANDRLGACREIRRWIFDGSRDCRIRPNNCAGTAQQCRAAGFVQRRPPGGSVV
ncbi:glycoside hydrolase family protein [Serratia ficaria]|uniref:glycoside hydrolase family protein n=1 Tax=Serratia ficaria TaxID=61651 RepID=UPI0021C752F3|nr:glycoside hydrolase family protein [Serratia ficaria]